MNNENLNIRLGNWIEKLQAKGKRAFAVRDIHEAFPGISDIAVKRSLSRLSQKGKVASIYKGYYLIIPPQYAIRGILPPLLFIDGFMKFLKRPYYVGLQSAAALHGAAHQQPQEFFVFTVFPALRATAKKGIKVNYISVKNIPEIYLQERKTESGYLKISSPELTAIDLIQFEKRVGGMNRVATILNELAEAMNPEKITAAFVRDMATTVVQRLGYLLDKELAVNSLADKLYDECMRAGLKFFRIPLKTSARTKGCSSNNRWNVIANIKIESDE